MIDPLPGPSSCFITLRPEPECGPLGRGRVRRVDLDAQHLNRCTADEGDVSGKQFVIASIRSVDVLGAIRTDRHRRIAGKFGQKVWCEARYPALTSVGSAGEALGHRIGPVAGMIGLQRIVDRDKFAHAPAVKEARITSDHIRGAQCLRWLS